MSKFAFVSPRYGSNVLGGAEPLVAKIAKQLSLRGHEVVILTTCAKDNRTWLNFYEPKTTIEDGLEVRRFLVDERNLDIWIPKQIAISDGFCLGIEDQLDWMQHSVNSLALYEELYRTSSEYEFIFFAPYLFGTTFWGSQIAPEKSILFPCLHDETAAYTDVMKAMFLRVKGCIFNAKAEHELARALYGNIQGQEVGIGLEFSLNNAIKKLGTSDRKSFFTEKFPYILCLGRKETGKNAQVLIDDFIKAKEVFSELQNFKLVIAGAGDYKDLHRDKEFLRDDIIDVPPYTEEEKEQLIDGCFVLLTPSTNESFSFVIMESWMQAKPVIVAAKCAVTRDHVIDSSGGLYYANAEELGATLVTLLKEPKLLEDMGLNGARYVAEKYNWNAVINRLENALDYFRNL